MQKPLGRQIMNSQAGIFEGSARQICEVIMVGGKPAKYTSLYPSKSVVQELPVVIYGRKIPLEECLEVLYRSIDLLLKQHRIAVPQSCTLVVQLTRSMYKRVGSEVTLHSRELVMEVMSIDGLAVPQIQQPTWSHRV